MTTKLQVLTPQDVGQAVELSGTGLWKKQILPARTIKYKGRDLKFDRRYFTDLSNSFRRRAFDQVPAQIATPDNKHNNDPRNFGGELVDLAVEGDGLYGIFRPSDAGAKILAENPKIGVSARILEGYQRSDGVSFPKALQHVLLTVDPHVNGMKPWEKVELSADEQPEDTIDLSSETEEETTMSTTRKATTKAASGGDGDGDGEEVTLSREEYAAFQELLAEREAALEFALNPEDVADLEDEDEEDEEDAGEPVIPEAVRLTMQAQSEQILELTNQARDREVDRAVERLQMTGLAPSIIEAARPLLGLRDQTIELSNGEEAHIGETVQHLLDAVTELARNGEAFIQYDLELGRTESDPESERREALLEAWDKIAPAN